MTKKDTVNFEASLKKLEQIVGKLEDGDISLEDSVKSFEEGIGSGKGVPKTTLRGRTKGKETFRQWRNSRPRKLNTEHVLLFSL